MHLAQPCPELPVRDVATAQDWYRDKLGFKIEWIYPTGEIGAVSHGDAVIFFRQTDAAFAPATFWMFSEDVDAAYETIRAAGVEIAEPIEDKPWGLRQFTFRDLSGNLFQVHHDAAKD